MLKFSLPWVDLANISWKMETKLMKEKNEGLSLESKVLNSVPGYQRDALLGFVIIEGDWFMREHRVLRNNSKGIHLDTTRIQENLLEPGDETSLALLDQAILQHLDL